MTTLTQDERELLRHAVAEQNAELLPLLSVCRRSSPAPHLALPNDPKQRSYRGLLHCEVGCEVTPFQLFMYDLSGFDHSARIPTIS